MSEQAEPQPEPQFNITLPDDKRPGVWANFALVSHSPYEFTIDFARLEFDGSNLIPGIVVQRVSLSPLMVTQLIEALQANWETYASRAMPPEVRRDATD